jgi:hypothetical protein
MTDRTCTRCKREKDGSEFYWNKAKDKPREWCKECYREWHRDRYAPKNGTDDSPRDCAWCGESFRPRTRRFAKFCSRECLNAERVGSGRARERHLMRKYGITLADYDRMLTEQGGGCAICGTLPGEQTRYQQFLHVDHCHVTGKVRGLLCDQHNLLLGRFDHDPALLRRAADYLEAAAS